MTDFNQNIIEEFRANHGKVGGPFEGAPMLILHTVGAKSGEERLSPMMYREDGDRYLVFASKGGAPAHPGWYHNLVANPDVTIEVGDATISVVATPLEGEEHDEKYAAQAQDYPNFGEYQKKTSRVIPVVALTPAG
jgi:deazaflavin-dependent oxidoreductase (nitroreductase family)